MPMLTPAQAESLILGEVTPFPGVSCALAESLGRVLRGEVRADRDLPPFDRVALDGYALRAPALAAGIRVFRPEAVQAAGMPASTLSAAEDACIEVMTGAVLPAGADCVVPYEESQREGASVRFNPDVAATMVGRAVHRQGSDHVAGEVLLHPGTRLTAREIAVAAACGYTTLSVSRQPRIAVVATGDELVEVGEPVAAHHIRRSNDHALRAALAAAGYPEVVRFHLPDDRDAIAVRLQEILADFDVVVLCGGVSKGKFDYLPAELEQQGVRNVFHGVAQRPGKPLWFGVSARRTPVFALPGNPVSAFTCLHRYVLPALARASGARPRSLRPVALAAAVNFKPALAYLLPVKLSSGPHAELLATPDPGNTSGDFAGLLGTDGFVELPPGPAEFPAGTLVPFWPWSD